MAKMQRIKKVELWSIWRILGAASLTALMAVSLMFAFGAAIDAIFGSKETVRQIASIAGF